MKPSLPPARALIWLAVLAAVLIGLRIGPGLVPGDPIMASVTEKPGGEAATLFVALPILVTAILLYAYSTTKHTPSKK